VALDAATECLRVRLDFDDTATALSEALGLDVAPKATPAMDAVVDVMTVAAHAAFLFFLADFFLGAGLDFFGAPFLRLDNQPVMRPPVLAVFRCMAFRGTTGGSAFASWVGAFFLVIAAIV
jgi:hypothetical protein